VLTRIGWSERSFRHLRVEQEGHMGEQSTGMASDIAVDRLAAISSVGDASREAAVSRGDFEGC
jgi:hypothetical protein